MQHSRPTSQSSLREQVSSHTLTQTQTLTQTCPEIIRKLNHPSHCHAIPLRSVLSQNEQVTCQGVGQSKNINPPQILDSVNHVLLPKHSIMTMQNLLLATEGFISVFSILFFTCAHIQATRFRHQAAQHHALACNSNNCLEQPIPGIFSER